MLSFFSFNDPAPPEIYTLSLHDALPISQTPPFWRPARPLPYMLFLSHQVPVPLRNLVKETTRSEEHTSELQSHHDLVCRLLLEKKKKKINTKQTQLTSTSSNPIHQRSTI